ncbi:MAG: hypothetical protein WA655_02340 [Candidatus Korobacteraceae bacterium]
MAASICLALLLPSAAHAQATGSDEAPQSGEATPTFRTESRQVIVEAEVWDKNHEKGKNDSESLADKGISPSQKGLLNGLPPPTRGLTAKDFHVFDNGVEQEINYLKEADFPAVDTTHQWFFDPTVHGTWGTALTFNSDLTPASATYLIGFVPPPLRPGECHAIKVTTQRHEVQVNRDEYCAPSSLRSDVSKADPDAKLSAKMLRIAASPAHSLIDVSIQAFTFWSSGVLSLVNEHSADSSKEPPLAEFRYLVEVHDAKAPATVQVAVAFDLPTKRWDYPCRSNDAIHVLLVAYKGNDEVATQLRDTFRCGTGLNYESKAWRPTFMLTPTRFDTQLNLTPGDYQLAVVVTDGDYFGKVRMPLQVKPLSPRSLMISDLVVGGVVRDAAWVLREAATVSPSAIIPSPLVSKNVQFFPDTDTPTRLGKRESLLLYFQIYQPLLEEKREATYYEVKITDLRTGSLVMNTGRMSADAWVTQGNTVIPIGLKLTTDKLEKGSYRLAVQASDATGQQTDWRQIDFKFQ